MNTAPPGAPQLRVSHFYKYNHWKVGSWRRYRPGSSTKGLRGPLALSHTGATSPCQLPAAAWAGYETGSGEKGQRHVTCSYITVPQYQSKPGTSPATQTLVAYGRGSEWGAARVMRARARRGCWHVANSMRYQVLPPLLASCNSPPRLLNTAQRRAHASPHTDRLRSRSCTPARRGCSVMVSAGWRGTHHPRGLSLPAARALQSGI